MRQFLDPFDIRLNLYSRSLSLSELSTPELKSLFMDMKNIATGERDENNMQKPSLVGLSAPQIGEFVRIILIDLSANAQKTNLNPNLKLFINPEIVETSKNENLMREGCYSTGRICGAVARPDWVKIRALDENGQPVEFESTNPFLSHIIQHEIDHLNGVRFPSRIRNTDQLHYVEVDDFQDYRENWANWHKLCPFEDWLMMYRGKK